MDVVEKVDQSCFPLDLQVRYFTAFVAFELPMNKLTTILYIFLWHNSPNRA